MTMKGSKRAVAFEMMLQVLKDVRDWRADKFWSGDLEERVEAAIKAGDNPNVIGGEDDSSRS